MILFEDLEQGTEEWEQHRLGVATASEATNIITPTGRLSKSLSKYAAKLSLDWANQAVDPDKQFMGNAATERGHRLEPVAREKFIEQTGLDVYQVGFAKRDDLVTGCSPDGLIKNKDGEWIAGLEIKCPLRDNYTETIAEMPGAHKIQCHWSMAVTGLPLWYYVVYHPMARYLHIEEIHADSFTKKVEQAMDDFIPEYVKVREKVLTAWYGEDWRTYLEERHEQ